MSEERSISRRSALMTLGAVGAAAALNPTRTASAQIAPPAVQTVGAKPAANVVDVAVGRMAKGHS